MEERCYWPKASMTSEWLTIFCVLRLANWMQPSSGQHPGSKSSSELVSITPLTNVYQRL